MSRTRRKADPKSVRRRDEKPEPAASSGTVAFGREWGLVFFLLGLAAVARLWGFGRLGLTHFDEGIYAIAGLWSVTAEGFNPELIAYAPPGYPILVGIAYTALGVSDAAPLLVSIFCGVLTVPTVALLARRTFGPGAGGAAAVLCTLSISHIAFSRKALTDAPFLLLWVTALGLGSRFLERPGFARAVALGLGVGLAQNVKYYGWLAGAVVVLAALSGLVRSVESRSRGALLKTFGWGLLAIVVSCVVYLPWVRFVETNGGYGDLLRHQRGYFLGPVAWLGNLRQQLGQVVALSGGPAWSVATWLTASIAWTLVSAGPLGDRWRIVSTVTCIGIGTLFSAFVPALGWWVGVAWLPWLLLDPRPSRRVLGAWWLSLSLLTPLYVPYARLWLPLEAAGWVLLAGTISTFCEFPLREKVGTSLFRRGRQTRPAVVLGMVTTGGLLIAAALGHLSGARHIPIARFFARTDGLEHAVSEIACPPSNGRPYRQLAVLARRPVAFYLALQGTLPFRILSGGDVSGPDPGEWALVDLALDATTVGPVLSEVAPGGTWALERRLAAPLDPVTLLDVEPGFAFGAVDEPKPLWLLRPDSPRD